MFRETINNYIIETMNLVIDKDMILFIIYYLYINLFIIYYLYIYLFIYIIYLYIIIYIL